MPTGNRIEIREPGHEARMLVVDAPLDLGWVPASARPPRVGRVRSGPAATGTTSVPRRAEAPV